MEDKTKYPAKTFKLNKETVKQLTELKQREGISWNLLFLKLAKEYDPRRNQKNN